MPEPLSFFIPVKGRFVSGDHDKIRTTDHHGKQEPDRAKHKYTFGVAFPKAELGPWLAEQLWPYLSTQWAANQDAMNRLNAWWKQPGLASKHGGVSMKITDGDRTDAKGRTNENTKGCFVFWLETFGSGYVGEHPHPAEPAKVFAGPNPNALVQIDLSQMKRGDYVTFAGTCVPNGKSGDQFGVYMNCSMIWKLEDGPAIVGGADPATAFAGSALTGSFDPSAGAGAAFGAAPAPGMAAPGNPTAPAPGVTGVAPAPGQAGTFPAFTVGGTASPISSATPHTDILNAVPGATPGLPGMPGT